MPRYVVITFTDGSKAPALAAQFGGCQFSTLGAAGKQPNAWIRGDKIRSVEMGENLMLHEIRVK
jgi:hypothetical protein